MRDVACIGACRVDCVNEVLRDHYQSACHNRHTHNITAIVNIHHRDTNYNLTILIFNRWLVYMTIYQAYVLLIAGRQAVGSPDRSQD